MALGIADGRVQLGLGLSSQPTLPRGREQENWLPSLILLQGSTAEEPHSMPEWPFLFHLPAEALPERPVELGACVDCGKQGCPYHS